MRGEWIQRSFNFRCLCALAVRQSEATATRIEGSGWMLVQRAVVTTVPVKEEEEEEEGERDEDIEKLRSHCRHRNGGREDTSAHHRYHRYQRRRVVDVKPISRDSAPT